MNAVMMTPVMVPRTYLQPAEPCDLSDVTRRSVHIFTSGAMADKADNTDTRPVPAFSESVQPGRILPDGAATPARSVLAIQRQADVMEKLICEAEISLAIQTAGSWRPWYASWRSRGVRVNDLLNMTWAWRQHARAGLNK